MSMTADCQLQDASILASPAVRRVAREHNVGLAAVIGTGSGGKITQGEHCATCACHATSRVIITHHSQRQIRAITPSLHQSKHGLQEHSAVRSL